jgi:parallel beta-helix repeat protein
MSNNQIHHNTAEGIHLYYSAGSILMTTIRENNVSFNFHGIYFNTGAQNSVIDRNIITNNTEYGIYANSGFHTISNNALWGNLVFEIIVVGTATTVIEKNALGIDADTDGDGLSDYLELCQIKTDRFLVDTDGDNYLDGYEVKNGTDPIDPLDFPEKLDITNITNNYITNNNTIYNCTCNATNANQTDNSDFVPLNDQIVGFPIQWIGLGSVGCIIVSSFKKKRVINRNIP